MQLHFHPLIVPALPPSPLRGKTHSPLQEPKRYRRRIQVACTRCRRRKVRCTGNPGNGSGCSACRYAGVDYQSCAFNRIGSQPLYMLEVDGLPATDSDIPAATLTAATWNDEKPPSTYVSGAYQTNYKGARYQYQPLSQPDQIRLLHISLSSNGELLFRLKHELLGRAPSKRSLGKGPLSCNVRDTTPEREKLGNGLELSDFSSRELDTTASQRVRPPQLPKSPRSRSKTTDDKDDQDLEPPYVTPTYHAVSYTWGNPVKGSVIYHEDTREVLFITKSAEMALRSLIGEGTLWIDGICINQDDVDERNQQVLIMGEIYRAAKKTFAYIGEHDEHSRPVLAWCDWTVGAQARMEDPLHLEKWPTVLRENVPTNDHKHAISVLNRPFFHRTWIVQEALLARDLRVRVGRDEIDYKLLGTWAWMLRGRTYKSHCGEYLSDEGGILAVKLQFTKDSDLFINAFRLWPPLSDMDQGSSVWEKSTHLLDLITSRNLLNPGHLFDLLYATTTFNCSDPRDKIFSLFGLLEGELPQKLHPNYTLGIEDVFTNISRFLLCYGVARVLSAATQNNEKYGMPSWTIDWRRTNLILRNVPGGRLLTKSTAGFKLFRGTNIIALDGCKIRIRGLRVAQVLICEYFKGYDDARTSSHQRRLSGFQSGRESIELKTTEGRSCVVPKEIHRDDHICIFLGFRWPFVLRPCFSDPTVWKLIGESYLEGFMDGEGVQFVEEHHISQPEPIAPLEDFVLV